MKFKQKILRIDNNFQNLPITPPTLQWVVEIIKPKKNSIKNKMLVKSKPYILYNNVSYKEVNRKWKFVWSLIISLYHYHKAFFPVQGDFKMYLISGLSFMERFVNERKNGYSSNFLLFIRRDEKKENEAAKPVFNQL